MKQLFILIALSMSLIACKGGGGGDSSTTSASIEGDIRNTAAVAWIPTGIVDFFIKEAAAADAPFNSPRSGLTNIDNPARLPDVAVSQLIEVASTATNTGSTTLRNVTIEIEIEHEDLLTPERWACNVAFSTSSGERSQAVWEEFGGTLGNEITTPALQACDGVMPTEGLCADVFPDGIDCNNPTWSVDYDLPGDGLWRGTDFVDTMGPGQQLTTAGGISMGANNVSNDRYARWIVKDQFGIVLAQKDYVFNATP